MYQILHAGGENDEHPGCELGFRLSLKRMLSVPPLNDQVLVAVDSQSQFLALAFTFTFTFHGTFLVPWIIQRPATVPPSFVSLFQCNDCTAGVIE